MKPTVKQLEKAKEIAQREKSLESCKYVKFFTHYKTPKSIYVEALHEHFSGGEYDTEIVYDCIDENANNLDCRNEFKDFKERAEFYSKMNEVKLDGITYVKKSIFE